MTRETLIACATMAVQMVVAALWNYASYGYMIGQLYFTEIFRPFDFVLTTVVSALLPGICLGLANARLLRQGSATVARGCLCAVLGLCTILISHWLFFRNIRDLCCGSTW
ncbi:hypothetical protein INH39_24580 [Massilia violaceinigra]|uniref:Uncharacterized protein n=1 Tax=Massilia violaceinigra TaxID=2045208 RepID=A0ABY4A1G8_9BURK|nr:hypothetical protein [Massilia violaceinigra]UOD28596.1 hypothetical protein INH39_24580 [Massilia violaceinigra]